MTSYRADGMDLTVSSIDKNYIESEYQKNTCERLDYGTSLLNEMKSQHNPKVKEINENITIIITNTRVNGKIDTDVAGIYHDEEHFIIIEGGDVEEITKITESIKILNK